MKFSATVTSSPTRLQTVQRAVSSRPGIPALTGVLMNASGAELVLATTDLEVSARFRLEVQVQQEGVALVPARLLADMVKSFDQAPVEFEAEGGQATIVCEQLPWERSVPAGRGLPACRTRPARGSPWQPRRSPRASARSTRAASRDEARPILTGRAARGDP